MTTHYWDRSWNIILNPLAWQTGDMAIFSPLTPQFGPEPIYRYLLGRDIEGVGPQDCARFQREAYDEGCCVSGKIQGHKDTVLFIMLNPSTADAFKLDPTVTRCYNYARAWGYGHLLVANLFALRSTDPDRLYHHQDPVGPDNMAWIDEAADYADKIVLAWGAHGNLKGQGDEVLFALHTLNISGIGYKTLYLKADIMPELWWPPG